MRSILIICSLISFCSLATAQSNVRKYTNREIGISFEVDSSWVLDSLTQPTTAYKKEKGEMITFHFQKMKDVNDFFKNINENDLSMFKEAVRKQCQSRGEIVKSIEIKKGTFLGNYGVITIAHIEGQSFLDGIPVYRKQINFGVKGNYIMAFIYFLPERLLTKSELDSIEKQISTFKIL